MTRCAENYRDSLELALADLRTIQEFLTTEISELDPDMKNWNMAGSAVKIMSDLQELKKFIYNAG